MTDTTNGTPNGSLNDSTDATAPTNGAAAHDAAPDATPDPTSDRPTLGDPRPLAVVTGAASGIGRGLAISLAADGFRVAMADRNAAGLEEAKRAARRAAVAGGHRAAGPGGHPVVDATALDIADFDEVKGWADAVVAKHGAPTDVYNAAGISVWGDPTTLPHAKWRGVIDINLMGTIHIVEAFTPAMADAGRGRLVCVSSAAGILGLPWHGAYAASKAGVLGLCEVLRFDLAPKGISVHAVAPGAVDTPLVRTIDIHGIDRGAPRVAKATKLFQGHAISPAKAAAIIRYEVDAGTYLIATSHDVHLGRWAQVNMPWAYRGVMKALNKGLRWAADGAETK